MTTIAFRTLVMKLPASPLGLLPARCTVAHWCATCGEEVAPNAFSPMHKRTQESSDWKVARSSRKELHAGRGNSVTETSGNYVTVDTNGASTNLNSRFSELSGVSLSERDRPSGGHLARLLDEHMEEVLDLSLFLYSYTEVRGYPP